MTDIGSIAYGDPGVGPPVNLPTLGLPPPPRERIRISPEARPKPVVEARGAAKPISADDYPEYTPPAKASGKPGAPPSISADDFPEYAPQAPKSMPEIGGGEAAAMGVRSALTAGAYPWLKGMGAAAAQQPQSFSQYPSMPEYSEAGITPEQAAQSVPTLRAREKALAPAYRASEAVRQPQYEYEQAAKTQHPWGYFGGEVGGGLLMGGAGAARTAVARGLGALSDAGIAAALNRPLAEKAAQGAGAALGRIGSATGQGATYGAASGVGETLSSGKQGEFLKNVGIGAGVGGAAGGLLSTLGEGVAPMIRRATQGGDAATRRVTDAKVRDVWANAGPIQPQDVARIRAANPAATPAQLHQQVIGDWIARGERGPAGVIDPEMRQAAEAAGRPLTNLDVGGTATERLARKAANTSEEAEGTIRNFGDQRFREQNPRVVGAIDNLTGGRLDLDALHARARAANAPAYDAAYAAGDRPIYTQPLHTVASSPTGQRAVGEALEAVGNEAASRGRIANLQTMQNGVGGIIPRNPNIEFWDQFHRALQRARDSASPSQARAIETMHRNVLTELDREVPEFAAARGGAGRYLGEENAYLAGRRFVDTKDPLEGVRAIRQYRNNPAERELFARGFATEVAQRVLGTPENRNALVKLNAIVSNPAARQTMDIALGQARANQLEALLRAEELFVAKRGVLGNSTTAKQLHDMGHSPQNLPVIAAIMEGAHAFAPGASIPAAIVYSLFKKHARNVEEHTMGEVARLLTSSDNREIARGVRTAARDPALLQALRSMSTAVTVGAAREPVAAGAAGYTASEGGYSLFKREEQKHHPQQQEMVPAEEAR